MATKIFQVEYWITERYNGKSPSSMKEVKSVTAKNALDAINKVRVITEKPSSYVSDQNNKKVKVTKSEYEPTSVNLLAETD